LPITSSTRHTPGDFRRATLALLMLGVTLCAALGGSATVGAATSAKPPMIRAAFYFGNASPLNFWSSDMSGAPAAFAQMQADGFNAVEFVVPWGEFQEGVSPVRYNPAAFKSLSSLVSVAKAAHLQVILRLSYGVAIDPHNATDAQYQQVFSNPKVYASWLGYISRVHQAVAKYNVVKIEQLSWEDFWTPVAYAQGATTLALRLQLATSTGYRAWLRSHYSLAQVSTQYGTTYTTWSRVPTPAYTSPSFALMFQYDDWALVHRFFIPAAARFPGLNLEARVDIDPIHNGTQVVGSYSHTDTFVLPGTHYIGTYYSPYLGDPSKSKSESADDALTGLQTTLATTTTRAKGRPLFIFEYQIESNSPEVAHNPALPPSQLPAFILGSSSAFEQYTLGYSLWTYRDYNQNPVFNPSFTLGTNGWTVTGSATPVQSPAGSSLTLSAGTSIKQTFPLDYLAGNPGSEVTVSFQASSASASAATINVAVGDAPVRALSVEGGLQTYTLEVPTADVVTGTAKSQITMTSTAPVSLSDVQVYNFTQLGDLYSVDGAPEVAVAPMQTLNQRLAGRS